MDGKKKRFKNIWIKIKGLKKHADTFQIGCLGIGSLFGFPPISSTKFGVYFYYFPTRYSNLSNSLIYFQRKGGGKGLELLWMLIVGGIIGWLGSLIIGRDMPGGVIGNIVAGFIGAWLGTAILGSIGPATGGFYIIPALLGAIIVVFIVSLIMRNTRWR